MGFKKGKKDKKAKKTKKSSRERTWDHEGGVLFDVEKNDNSKDEIGDTGDVKRKRRETQDRDERLRRGHAKIVFRKNQIEQKKKWSKKIKFSDFLVDKDTTKGFEDAAQEVTRKEPRKPYTKSSKSVFERLQSLIGKSQPIGDEGNQHISSKKRRDSIDNTEDAAIRSQVADDADADADAAVYDDDNENDDDNERNIDELDLDATEVVSDHEVNDVEEDGVLISSIEDDGIADSSSSQWFFGPSSEPLSGRKSKYSKRKIVSGDTIYYDLNSAVVPHLKEIRRVGDLPGVHKMWGARCGEPIVPLGRDVLPFLSTFADVFWEGRDHVNDGEIIESLVIHAAVHVVRARSTLMKHNQKLKRKAGEIKSREGLSSKKKGDKKKNQSEVETIVEVPVAYQDQGYTRPRVLILCPFRGTACKIVKAMKTFLGNTSTISQYKKFIDEFGSSDSDEVDEAEEDELNKKKPADWTSLFKQNVDDDFKFGLQINPGQGKGSGVDKGAYVRMYSDFYLSDVIIASPLGLRLVVEASNMNFDFLSSIEMVIIHQADVLYMQNWDHLSYILGKCNNLPENDHESDFSRIRPYFLDDKSSEHRQLIVVSHFNEPKIQALFREFGKSCAGNVRVKKEWGDGCIPWVQSKIHQVFQVVPCASFQTDEDDR